ncbi:MAG: hypothetical protein KA059_04320 [Elusimicrobiales bacterium]|jgi:predicted nucleotidyltransferase|nr:hypothetical protein [Elusimicrobiales bacterium]
MYETVFKSLNDNGIRYLVVGGVAVLLYGFLRVTADLDIMIDFDDNNIKSFIKTLKNLGYKPKVPVSLDDFALSENREKWKKEKGMLVFSLYHPQHPEDIIDVFIYEPVPFIECYHRRKLIYAEDLAISVISIEDLISLKKISGREQDLEDIKALNEIKKEYEK